jgi:hypothetical protein
MQDVWTYDAAKRRLHDENGLTVAENVNPGDAARVVAALAGPHGAFASIVADMLAYEADKFDGEPVFDVWQEGSDGDRKIRDGVSAEDVAKIRAENPAESYYVEQFERDLSVSGGDLVEAFAEWRGQLKAAIS